MCNSKGQLKFSPTFGCLDDIKATTMAIEKSMAELKEVVMEAVMEKSMAQMKKLLKATRAAARAAPLPFSAIVPPPLESAPPLVPSLLPPWATPPEPTVVLLDHLSIAAHHLSTLTLAPPLALPLLSPWVMPPELDVVLH